MMTSLFVLFILSIVYEVISVTPLPLSTLESHAAEVSPRKQMLEDLADSGCTDKLVAHYVIDLAVHTTLPITAIDERIEGITTVSSSDVGAWRPKVEETISRMNGE